MIAEEGAILQPPSPKCSDRIVLPVVSWDGVFQGYRRLRHQRTITKMIPKISATDNDTANLSE